MLTAETISGVYWACLSTDKQSTYNSIKQKLPIIPDVIKPYYEYCLNYYENFENFPTIDNFLQKFPQPFTVTYSLEEAESTFKKILVIFEQNDLCSQLQNAPLINRSSIIKKLTELDNTPTEAVTLNSTESFSLKGTVIKGVSNEDKVEYSWPTKHLNQRAPLREGYLVGILGTPGSGKSGLGLTIAYENSVKPKSNRNTLYIYGENTEAVYQAELRSRYSYDIGFNIENTSLKQGVFEDDDLAVKKIQELEDKFQSESRGSVYFLPMSSLPKEATAVGPYLSNLVKKYNLNLIVVDHLQCFLSFKPGNADKVEYLNTIVSSLRMLSIGLLGSHPVITVVLSQVNRETQARQERTSKITLGSSYACSSLDHDAFVVISVVATPESKQGNLIQIQILKNRDGDVDIAPLPAPAMFQYCKYGDIGDVGGSEDLFTTSSLDDLFDDL